MKLYTGIPIVLALLAAPAVAQSTSQVKKELKSLEKAAKKDPEALFNAGKYAKENGLDKDAKRLFEKVLKLEPDHSGANLALGNEQVEGKWIPAKEAQKLREKALEAKYASQGFKKIDDIWVEPDKVDDARKGIFWHEGEKVSHAEKVLMQNGHVRHPVTGFLIKAEDLQKAKDGYFPVSATIANRALAMDGLE